jgi:glycerophosphoryl diester phosphodiesterase
MSVAPEVIAHRGNSCALPENTVAALQGAVELGVHGVEIDLRTTADGELVLMHDEELERTTGAQGTVGEFTLAQIRSLDAGSWKHARYAGEPVPTLEEAALSLGKTTQLFAEVKRGPMAERIALVAEKTGIMERLTLLCWGKHPQDIADAKRWLPEVQVLELGDAPDEFGPEFFAARRAAGVTGFDYKFSTLTFPFLAAARDAGMPVYTWTVNDPEEMKSAISMNLDGITTDDPATLLDLI